MSLPEQPALNVMGGPLEQCGTDPTTGFYRDAHERALDVIPLEALREHAIDVPDDPGGLT